jgi:hypothetical protein
MFKSEVTLKQERSDRTIESRISTDTMRVISGITKAVRLIQVSGLTATLNEILNPRKDRQNQPPEPGTLTPEGIAKDEQGINTERDYTKRCQSHLRLDIAFFNRKTHLHHYIFQLTQ